MLIKDSSSRERVKKVPLLSPLISFRRRLISYRYSYRNKCLEKNIDLRGQEASDSIFSLLGSGQKCFIGRFGSCELGIVSEYYRGKGRIDVATNILVRTMAEKGGFYPVESSSVRRFTDLYVELMGNIDILGSWCIDELFFRKKLRKAKKIPLSDLEPYVHESPWTRALTGKKVLVINPLISTIRNQYEKRKLLFTNPDVLPGFDLMLYRPVYEFGNAKHEYESWFAALDKMKSDIAKIEFDTAILGCGPFGMPLADYIKKRDRQAVVLGGATQILFGIKGGRWDKDPFFRGLYNDEWKYPSRDETPKDAMSLEGGCYWKPSEAGNDSLADEKGEGNG